MVLNGLAEIGRRMRVVVNGYPIQEAGWPPPKSFIRARISRPTLNLLIAPT